MSKKLVNLIRMKFMDSNGKVKTQGQIERGLRQGGALSTTLFNIVLEKVTRNIETKPNGKTFSSRQYVAYADDVLILGRSTMAIEGVTQS